jgi:exodeoxyribonuclease VII large subunit
VVLCECSRVPDRTLDLFAGSPDVPPPAPEPRVFSVTELTRVVRGVLETAFEEVWVQGEISNFRQQASGHQYFTLKDAECQLPCVRFARPGLWRKNGSLQDGMQVQARGRLTVYEARGQYQLNVSIIQPAGAGLLQAKFEALKRKLDAEGLFDAERKRSLPRFPRALGIVTSPSGAALRDMLNVLARRAPWLRVIISPARVQGDGAAIEMISALRDLQRIASSGLAPVDVVIVARGGGSMEDLWEFNHEGFARAIAASSIPVISAVGHEIDFTISDFVADLRAPTPSAAAELVAPDLADLQRQLQQRAAFFHRYMTASLAASARHVANLARAGLFREPRILIEQLTQRLDSAEQALTHATRNQLNHLGQLLMQNAAELRQFRPDRQLAFMRQKLEAFAGRSLDVFRQQVQRRRERLNRVVEMLRLLSPDHTLQRGYTLTTDATGKLLRSSADAAAGSTIVTKFRDGKTTSVVQGPAANEKPSAARRKRGPKNDDSSGH